MDLEARGDQGGGTAPVRAPMGSGWTDTARLETFSDGVIAIAITLLILEVKVPHVAGTDLGDVLRHQWPSFAAYVVSFVTIGVMWVNHHHMFRLIERSNHTFLILNVLFLMTIAFLPWPTVLVATYIHDPDGRIVATVAYGATMVAVAIMFNVVWGYAAARGGRLLIPEVDRATLPRVSRSYLVGPTVYGAATLIALIDPYISLAVFAALALFWLLPRSGTRQAGTLS